MIEVRNLTFSYDRRPENAALTDITFSIKQGTVTAVIGPSGCGKSTLCQILCGIIPQCISGEIQGEVRVGGTDVQHTSLRDLSQKIGYVMQDPDRQIIASTVEDELAFGPENLCLPPEEIRVRIEAVKEALGICHLAEKNPGKLSGGQKQLIAIGGILAMEPEVLILDEPLSQLDREGRERITGLMKKLRAQGKTLLAVEHDYRMLDFADQWICLERGRLKAIGSPGALLERGVVL